MTIDPNLIIGGFCSLLAYAVTQWNRMGKNDKATNGRIDVLETKQIAIVKTVDKNDTEFREFVSNHLKNEVSMNDKIMIELKEIRKEVTDVRIQIAGKVINEKIPVN